MGYGQPQPYPTDVSDEEWAFVAPYLILFSLDVGQRRHDLREVFNALRYVVRTGCPCRMLPNDLPPWARVHQQMQHCSRAGCFEAVVHDLRMLLRLADGRTPHPSAAILDSRTLQSTPTSGARAGYDGAKRKKGSKVHPAVDTLGNLLALRVTPANEQYRDQVGQLAQAIQEVSNQEVTLAYVDQGYTGQNLASAALSHGITLEVVKLTEPKRGFLLLPRRWVVERNFGWAARFRRLARNELSLLARQPAFERSEGTGDAPGRGCEQFIPLLGDGLDRVSQFRDHCVPVICLAFRRCRGGVECVQSA